MTKLIKLLSVSLLLAGATFALVVSFNHYRGTEITCRDGFIYEGSDRALRIMGTLAFHLSRDQSGYASITGSVSWQGQRFVISRESRFRYASVDKNTLQISSVHFYADQRDTLPPDFSPDKLLESLFFRPPPERLMTVRRIANVWLLGNINSSVFACTA